MKSPYLGEGLVGFREVPARGSLKTVKLEQSAPFLGRARHEQFLHLRGHMGCRRGKGVPQQEVKM